ncbi:putative reverse transcriptase domain-containing protein [Tanacetum coccineum]
MYGTKCMVFTDHQSLQYILNQNMLNMRHRRWIELLSNYDCELKYHLGKANVVVDALSRKQRLRPSRKLYNADHKLEVCSDGVRYLKARAWIPKVNNLRDVILDESCLSRYSIHPGADKMHQDVKEYYGWPGIKKDIVVYVRKCLSCAKVKAEYQKPSDLLQQPKIPRALGTQLDMSTANHPQTEGQSERTIQTIEDMLRACMIDFKEAADKLDIIEETVDKIKKIKERLKTVRRRQKRYAKNHRKALEFQVRDSVLLKVSRGKA